MTIYKIFDDAKHFRSFHLDNEAFLDLLDASIGEAAAMQFSQRNIALAAYWKPLHVSCRNNDDSENKLPDIGLWRSASLILSPTAVEALHPMLTKLGELLPLNFESREYFLFNCLTEVAADENHSLRVEEDGFFMGLERLTFPFSTDVPIFKSPFENNRNLFCAGTFRSAVESAGLGGIYWGENLVDFI